jgi:hypothetical protein
MNEITEYIVNLNWDSEASVWFAMSDDIPGLALESGSFDALIERVRFAVPELLHLNAINHSDDYSLCFRTERHEKAYA